MYLSGAMIFGRKIIGPVKHNFPGYIGDLWIAELVWTKRGQTRGI